MDFRPLGSTGISVSAISFGAGPVPALMTSGGPSTSLGPPRAWLRGGRADQQRDTIRRAIEAGINWFDTAATYGDGESERSLGGALRELGASSRAHVATKVRLMPDQLDRIKENVKASVRASLQRLQLDRVALIQLHNSITRGRGDQHTSITPADVLSPGGVWEAFCELRAEGLVSHLGLTALGDAGALGEVIDSGEFEAVQVCYNILAGCDGEDGGAIIRKCAEKKLGVIAIRVLAGGALAGQPPSAHTLMTKFFPLAIYQRDAQKAERLAKILPPGMTAKEAAVRFVLSHGDVSTALIGFSGVEQVDEAIELSRRGPLPADILKRLA